ncbi:PREDICTED: uncharacterized protein LOC104810909 [Tarenaya hassleriana]|uniref:uncharacterized protein LOC104810909 n=1 Tax=Tarenaya hassleriana TaxID=28532 RepID=UPI00053C2E4A|nr:PREDICTED: uncharacterized protein LOC104810909 [Tarenaya hassleriana]
MNLILNSYVDADTALPELDSLLNQEVVNFEKAKTYVVVMKAGSGCLGGCRMSQACQELRLQCEAENRERCLELLERVKEEYIVFRDCLNHVTEIVRNILVSGVGFRRD